MLREIYTRTFCHAVKAIEAADIVMSDALLDIFDAIYDSFTPDEKIEEIIEIKVRVHLYYNYVRHCLSLNRLDYESYDGYFKFLQ